MMYVQMYEEQQNLIEQDMSFGFVDDGVNTEDEWRNDRWIWW